MSSYLHHTLSLSLPLFLVLYYFLSMSSYNITPSLFHYLSFWFSIIFYLCLATYITTVSLSLPLFLVLYYFLSMSSYLHHHRLYLLPTVVSIQIIHLRPFSFFFCCCSSFIVLFSTYIMNILYII